jgi:hypothetical protein
MAKDGITLAGLEGIVYMPKNPFIVIPPTNIF